MCAALISTSASTSTSTSTSTLKVGSFNILADGLGHGEFFCEGGDQGSIDWTVRRPKIVAVLANMLASCDVVVTQENDHFIQILDDLITLHELPVAGVFVLKSRSKARPEEKAKKAKPEKKARPVQTSIPETNAKPRTRAGDTIAEPEAQLGVRLNAIVDVESGEKGTTFQDESPTYAAAFASALYRLGPTDLYPLDNGVGVYFRQDRLTLTGAHAVNDNWDSDRRGSATECVSTGVLTVVPDPGFAVACTFTHGSGTVHLYGAHLCSGEHVSREKRRCEQLDILFRDAALALAPTFTKGPDVGDKTATSPVTIIAMDSNSSAQYESAYPADAPKMSKVIAKGGFVDAIALQTGNECFKMRHGRGDQPSKYYQFMFDTIDKILVPSWYLHDGSSSPSSPSIVPHVYNRYVYGFSRYDPLLQPELRAIRESEDLRTELAAFASAVNAAVGADKDACSVATFGQSSTYDALRGLYPNLAAPSDHPPVSCIIQVDH